MNSRTPGDDGMVRGAATMAVGTLLSRITGAVRTFALLSFGFAGFTDAYTQANTTPNLVYELIAGGVLSATLVPLFATLLRRNSRRATDGLNAIVSLFGVIVTAGSVLLGLIAPWILRLTITGDRNELKLHVATQLLRLFAAQVAFYGMITIANALLGVRRRWFAQTVVAVLNNVVVIVVLLVVRYLLNRSTQGGDYLEKLSHESGIRLILGLGTTLGVAVQAMSLLPELRKVGVRVRWHWEPNHPAVRELVRVAAWTFGYVVSNQIAIFVILRLANRGNDGDVTAYSTTFSTFFQLPHGLFAVSIATALQPVLSEAFIEHRRRAFRNALSKGVRTQLAVMVPAAVVCIVLAEPIVAVVRTGSFSAENVARAAGVLQCFAIGLPFFSGYLLLMNACKAMRDTRTTFVVNAVENTINIALAVAFIALGWGVRGLALSFALAYVAAALIAFAVLSRRLRGLDEHAIAASLVRIVAAALAMAIALGFGRELVSLVVGPGRVRAVLQVGAGGSLGVTVYVVAARLVGVREINSVVAGVSRRFARSARR